jgi:O-antigen/teichoic acid export membrane protein
MISGLVAVAYSQIDRIMLKSMLNSTSVGLYSASLTIAGMWSIIPSAIIQSVTPVLYRNADENYPLFIRRLRQSYALIWGLNVLWSVGISVLNYWVVYLLYGSDYMGARGSLVIVVWYTGIASLGSLTQVYLATGNKNKYVNYFAVAGLFTDVVLNALLIPRFGIEGAAVATLATYCVIHIIMPVVFRDTREAGKLILEAMIFRNVVDDDMKQFVRKLILKKAG